MGAIADNPIRLTYKALWDLVEQQAQFTAAVPGQLGGDVVGGNRIKYTGTDRSPEKDQRLQPADFPEVRLVPVKIMPWLKRTSNGASLTVNWAWQIMSGDQRFQTLFDVDWALYLALDNWSDYLTTGATAPLWKGQKFIRRCRPLEVPIEMDASTKNKGWRDAWMGETDLWFATADLAAE